MSNLPASWAICNFGELIERIEAGLNVKCEERPPENSERGLVKISAVTWGRFDEMQSKTLPSEAAPDISKKINKGDLLFSRANTLELVGASVIVHQINKELYLSDKVLRLVIVDGMKSWVNYALKTQAIRKAIGEASSGNQMSMRNISQDKLKALELPVAPLAEQRRIADKLDTVLTRVDAVQNRLARITPLLKRFRQSILAAATSGRLTEEWRGHEAQWPEVKLSEIGLLGRGKSRHRPRNDPALYGGIYPFIQTGDVANSGEFIVSHSQTYTDLGLAQSKLWPVDTLCITIAANIADTAILSYPACFPDSVVGFVSNKNICHTRYVKWFIESIKNTLEQFAPATAQKNINLSVLENVMLKLPPLEEQTEIVRRIELLMGYADRLEARLQAAQTAAERLTPALLAKAFRGELVPQDPSDEPASELLRRLREARAAQAPAKATRGRKATVTKEAA